MKLIFAILSLVISAIRFIITIILSPLVFLFHGVNRKGTGEEALKRAIGVAYAREGELIPTKIPWWEAEKFIVKREKEVNNWDDGGMSGSVDMLVNGDEVVVTLVMDNNKMTLVEAENAEIRAMKHKEHMRTLGVDI